MIRVDNLVKSFGDVRAVRDVSFAAEDGKITKMQRTHVEEGFHASGEAGAGGQVEILEGVSAGERVAARGTFTLKSMARSGELGHGHSH